MTTALEIQKLLFLFHMKGPCLKSLGNALSVNRYAVQRDSFHQPL